MSRAETGLFNTLACDFFVRLKTFNEIHSVICYTQHRIGTDIYKDSVK